MIDTKEIFDFLDNEESKLCYEHQELCRNGAPYLKLQNKACQIKEVRKIKVQIRKLERKNEANK